MKDLSATSIDQNKVVAFGQSVYDELTIPGDLNGFPSMEETKLLEDRFEKIEY